MSSHEIVTCLLWYLEIGAVIWCAMYASGLITETARRRDVTAIGVFLASVAVIVAWPVLAFAFFGGMWSARR